MQDTVICSQTVKAEASRLGFSACGIAPSGAVDTETVSHFTDWLHRGGNAAMDYMNNYKGLRFNSNLLLDNCKSVICVALNYYPEKILGDDQYQFAYYAYGKDYHDVMRSKLTELASAIKECASPSGGTVQTRTCVDTAPLMERYWAQRSGIGWIGKNHNLILPHQGSFVCLGEVLVDCLADYYDLPMESRCGNCRRCIDACPGHAIRENVFFDASRCLSYISIERRGDFNSDEAHLMAHQSGHTPYIYGCDRCQLACPHNRFAKPNTTEELQPTEQFLGMTRDDWHNLSVTDYRSLFKGSAVKRAKYDGIRRNVDSVNADDGTV